MPMIDLNSRRPNNDNDRIDRRREMVLQGSPAERATMLKTAAVELRNCVWPVPLWEFSDDEAGALVWIMRNYDIDYAIEKILWTARAEGLMPADRRDFEGMADETFTIYPGAQRNEWPANEDDPDDGIYEVIYYALRLASHYGDGVYMRSSLFGRQLAFRVHGEEFFVGDHLGEGIAERLQDAMNMA